MVSLNITKQRLLALAGAAALTLSVAGPAMAADPNQAVVTTNVTGGSLSVMLAIKNNMTSVPHSITAQTSQGKLTVTAIDETGTDNGYTVSMQASNFIGASATIASENLKISTLDNITAGAAYTGSGPTVPDGAVNSTFDVADTTSIAVMSATGANGDGQWSEDVGLDLAVAPLTPNGDYQGTVIVTIAPIVQTP